MDKYIKDLEKIIKNLEEIINLSKEEIDNNNNNITAILDLEDLKSLMNLLTRYKQLEEENKDLKLKERNRALGRYGEIEVHNLINKVLSEDYIPTSLVKEKIEDLEKRGYFEGADAMKDLLERSGEDE